MAFIVEVYLRGENNQSFLSQAHSRYTHIKTKKEIAEALSKEFNLPFLSLRGGIVTEGDSAPIVGALVERVPKHEARRTKYEELKCQP